MKKKTGTSLSDLRKEIVACDEKLIELLDKRLNISLRIGAYKTCKGLLIICKKIEGVRIKDVLKLSRKKGIKNPEFIRAFMYLLMTESCRIQMELKESGKIKK